MELFLKGDRCYTDKCALKRRNYPPGQHGQGRSKTSDYGVQLREKQKVKRLYGLLEKQFRSYFDRADRMKVLQVRTCLPSLSAVWITLSIALALPLLALKHVK